MSEDLNNRYGDFSGSIVVDYEEMPSLSLNQRVRSTLPSLHSFA